jgi:hypothetical protein
VKTKLFISICFFLAGKMAFSQSVYTMPATGTQTDTVCGGIFYDSGGPVGNYTNSGNGIMVLCSALPGQFVLQEFTSITLNDASDRLRIFSGSDTMGIPLAIFAGPMSSAGCGTILVSTDSSGGCLTAHFRSGSTGNASGWKALLYCNPTVSTILQGTDCANPVVIPSIPFTDANQCTECMANNYQAQGGICNATYAGEDKVYQYTASGPETVCITMSNTTGNPTLAIYQGCPGSGGSCVTPIPMVANDTMQFTFPGAGTYYIIIDATSGFSCYTLDIASCIVGINEQENSGEGASIFPSPVTNELRIENELKIGKIELYNFAGEKIFEKHMSPGVRHSIISVADFTPGIYFIIITTRDNKIIRKIVKQ